MDEGVPHFDGAGVRFDVSGPWPANFNDGFLGKTNWDVNVELNAFSPDYEHDGKLALFLTPGLQEKRSATPAGGTGATAGVVLIQGNHSPDDYSGSSTSWTLGGDFGWTEVDVSKAGRGYSIYIGRSMFSPSEPTLYFGGSQTIKLAEWPFLGPRFQKSTCAGMAVPPYGGCAPQ